MARWRIYDGFVFETEDDAGNVFMLASGDWHKASSDFIEEINAQLATLKASDLDLPPQTGARQNPTTTRAPPPTSAVSAQTPNPSY